MFDAFMEMSGNVSAEVPTISTFKDSPGCTGEKLPFLTESVQRRPVPVFDSDCDSFAGDAAPACDDLLDVNQHEINVEFTFPSTVCMTPSAYSGSPSVCTDPFDCSDEISTTSWTSASNSIYHSKEGSPDSSFHSSSQMDETRMKLLHSMERTCESRRALKRRRLCGKSGAETEGSYKQIYDRLQSGFELMN